MTDRDDFSLPSTVVTSFAGSGAGGPVIKILIGGQARRVPAHRLVREGSKNQKPSYGLLRTLIAKYAFPDRKAPGRDCEVTTTYVDDDGDAVTISTDDELEDALSAVIAEAGEGKKQVLRIDAAVKERAAGAETEGAKGVDEKPKAAEAEVAKDQKKQQIPERKLACGQVGKLQWDLLAVGEGDLDAESKDAADRLVRDIVGSIALGEGEGASVGEEDGEDEDKKKDEADAAAPAATENFMPKAEPLVFIHARHTCDGCGISPIMGVRHHATDRADYDLCQGCFADPSVGGLDRMKFVTEELDRDRVMQQRWGRRFARGRLRCGRSRRCHNGSLRQHHRQVRRHCPVPPAQQRFANNLKKAAEQKQDDSDMELQEAVLRSVQEKQAPVESKEGKGDGKVEEKKEAEEETDSKATAPAGEDTAANWRSVADSFSSAAAGSGDFADVLDAVTSVVATEIEKQADVAADATRLAGDAAANSTRSAADASIPNGIAAAITAAMNASRVASTVASEVKAVIDKELQKKQTEEGSPTSDSGPSDEEKGEDVPSVEGDERKPAEVAEGALVEPEDDEAKGDNESEKSDAPVVSEGGEAKKGAKDEDEANEDNESEKSDWEDVGAEEDKVEVASDDGSTSSAPIAPPVLAHWAEQLKVLHQLGFTDDLKSVDALETLQAANVGVESTDEVTVGDAVNFLLTNAGD